MIIHLVVGLIKKILYKMSQYFPKPYKPFGGDIIVKADLSDLLSLKTEVDKIDVDKLKTVPDDLSNLKVK